MKKNTSNCFYGPVQKDDREESGKFSSFLSPSNLCITLALDNENQEEKSDDSDENENSNSSSGTHISKVL